MKALLFVLAATFFVPPAIAQVSLARSVIGSAGMSVTTDSFTLSFTLGEVLTGVISLTDFCLRQGFQQPCTTTGCTVVPVKEPHFDGSFRVFPNPADKQLTLELVFDRAAALRWSLISATGVPMRAGELQFSGDHTEIFDLSELPPGLYFLQLYDLERQARAATPLVVMH